MTTPEKPQGVRMRTRARSSSSVDLASSEVDEAESIVARKQHKKIEQYIGTASAMPGAEVPPGHMKTFEISAEERKKIAEGILTAELPQSSGSR